MKYSNQSDIVESQEDRNILLIVLSSFHTLFSLICVKPLRAVPVGVSCVCPKEPLNQSRLAAWHPSCLHLFRHLRQKSSEIRQDFLQLLSQLTKNLLAHSGRQIESELP